MNIGIGVQHILNKKTGIGYYTDNLIKHLQRIDKQNYYRLIIWKLFFKRKEKPIQISNSNFSYKFIRFFPLKIYNTFFKLGLGLPLDWFVRGADIFVFANFTRYPVLKSKTVIIIYDLSYLKYPNFGEPKNVKFLTKMVPKSIHKADHIVTISKNSKKEIIETYNISEDRISIIYPAVDYNFFKPADKKAISQIKKEYHLKNNYFLFTSTLEPRKNIVGIIKAYVSLPSEIKEKYDLVLAGGKGWQDQEILEAINKAREARNKIITPGYVPEQDLPALYSGAYLFCYPSLYEGFGIPILEAMACGVPVITSDRASIPEVAGDAALLVNPKNIEAIKESIIKVVSDQGLRDNLIKKGFNQTKKFSWGRSAKELIKVFEKVYKKIKP